MATGLTGAQSEMAQGEVVKKTRGKKWTRSRFQAGLKMDTDAYHNLCERIGTLLKEESLLGTKFRSSRQKEKLYSFRVKIEDMFHDDFANADPSWLRKGLPALIQRCNYTKSQKTYKGKRPALHSSSPFPTTINATPPDITPKLPDVSSPPPTAIHATAPNLNPTLSDSSNAFPTTIHATPPILETHGVSLAKRYFVAAIFQAEPVIWYHLGIGLELRSEISRATIERTNECSAKNLDWNVFFGTGLRK